MEAYITVVVIIQILGAFVSSKEVLDGDAPIQSMIATVTGLGLATWGLVLLF